MGKTFSEQNVSTRTHLQCRVVCFRPSWKMLVDMGRGRDDGACWMGLASSTGDTLEMRP